MKQNVGTLDRTLRIVIGLGLIIWGIANENWLGAIGIIPLTTGFLRFCPAYCPFGISTGGSGSCCGGGSCKTE